jgi:hypothetical protein
MYCKAARPDWQAMAADFNSKVALRLGAATGVPLDPEQQLTYKSAADLQTYHVGLSRALAVRAALQSGPFSGEAGPDPEPAAVPAPVPTVAEAREARRRRMLLIRTGGAGSAAARSRALAALATDAAGRAQAAQAAAVATQPVFPPPSIPSLQALPSILPVAVAAAAAAAAGAAAGPSRVRYGPALAAESNPGGKGPRVQALSLARQGRQGVRRDACEGRGRVHSGWRGLAVRHLRQALV